MQFTLWEVSAAAAEATNTGGTRWSPPHYNTMDYTILSYTTLG